VKNKGGMVKKAVLALEFGSIELIQRKGRAGFLAICRKINYPFGNYWSVH
jgi:hypothetical protein